MRTQSPATLARGTAALILVAAFIGGLNYSWSMLSGIHGTVKVLLDAAGTVAQASFTVS